MCCNPLLKEPFHKWVHKRQSAEEEEEEEEEER
jgi:hypothetical protein